MEYVNTGEWARAIPEFEAVLVTDPGYSAAYYHGGQTLEKLGRLDDAPSSTAAASPPPGTPMRWENWKPR